MGFTFLFFFSQLVFEVKKKYLPLCVVVNKEKKYIVQ